MLVYGLCQSCSTFNWLWCHATTSHPRVRHWLPRLSFLPQFSTREPPACHTMHPCSPSHCCATCSCRLSFTPLTPLPCTHAPPSCTMYALPSAPRAMLCQTVLPAEVGAWRLCREQQEAGAQGLQQGGQLENLCHQTFQLSFSLLNCVSV